MMGRGLILFLLFLAGQQYSGLAALCAKRSLSANTAMSGMLLEVAISLSSTDTLPSALILTETLPPGLQFQSAAWNANPFAPSGRDGQTLKWFFGPGGKTVSEGILEYQLRVLTDSPQKVFFAGFLQMPGAEAVPVSGERILWLNPAECAAPVFSPASDTVFEDELLVSLRGDATAGAEIFFCFGEPVFWEDWQLYEGTFSIQHSQQLQAQTWLADGRASMTARAEYHRRGTCPITLRRGWNLIGIPLELSAQEGLKLQKMPCFLTDNRRSNAPEKLGICGQVFWIFSEEDGCLLLAGMEPFDRRVPSVRKAGWEAVSPVGLEIDRILHETEAFWVWENNRYQLAKKLHPGKGYWRFQQPGIRP